MDILFSLSPCSSLCGDRGEEKEGFYGIRFVFLVSVIREALSAYLLLCKYLLLINYTNIKKNYSSTLFINIDL